MEMSQSTGLLLLRQQFPKHLVSVLPKPTKKDNPKGKCSVCNGYHGLPAVHLDYVGHAALTDRLLDADPEWYWEPLALENGLPAFDKNGGLWIKLTVCGVTRLGYGNAEHSTFKEVGSREKEVIGDALRNAAMRFGAALDLWHKGDLHVDEEKEVQELKQQTEHLSKQKVEPKKEAQQKQPDNRHPSQEQIKRLFAIAHDKKWETEQVKLYMTTKFEVESTTDLNRDQYDEFVSVIESTNFVGAMKKLTEKK